MTLFRRRQPGSSLLMIVLIMAVVGTIVLAGSKAIIDSSRQTNASNDAASALLMAQTGIQDGLLLYKKGFLLNGEYGDSTNGGGHYVLRPVRRGYQKTDPTCTFFDVDQPAASPATSYNPDCPYYDLTVRDTTSVHNERDTYTLSTRELPNNLATVIPLKENPGITFLLNTIPGGLTYDYTTCSSNYCTPGTEITTLNGQSNPNFDIVNGVLGLKITPHYSLNAGGHPVVVAGIKPIGAGTTWNTNVSLGKGFTTVDVVGYAGPVRKKLLLTIRPHDHLQLESPEVNPSYNVLDFAQSFDNYGVLIP